MGSIAKQTWLLHLATISVCAYFSASAAGKLLIGLAPQPGRAAGRSSPAVPPAMVAEALAAPRDPASIVGRNIFCSACKPAPAETEAACGAGPTPAKETGPVLTTLKLTLTATLLSEEDPASSFACIVDGETQEARMYGVGARVPGDAVLTEVQARQVVLLHGGRSELLQLSGEGGTTAVASVTPEPGIASEAAARIEYKIPDPAAGLEDRARGIRRTGGSSYSVDRGILDRLFTDTSSRFIPTQKDGQANGFAMYAPRGSLPTLLGFFSGDILQSVNGQAVPTAEKAAEALRGLGSATSVSLTFTRKGTAITHDYQIR